jgi:cellulose synthase/poly-beta-1,6-N-acetylglucosamine synthase-like glycosyltransferase
VLNAEQTAVAGLRYAALAAVHYLRPLGRSVFGWSSGLKGNGMCFEASILREFTWRWFTLAEDVEFHLALVEQGVSVQFAPETWVKADMPLTLQQSASQNSRWERGRLQLIRQHVPRLVLSGIRRRSWLPMDAAIEQLIPPLSVPFALGAISIPAAWLVGAPLVAGLALGCLIGYALYLVAALALVKAPLRIYVTLGMAPVYIAWKVGLYARSLLGGRSGAWVRTARV